MATALANKQFLMNKHAQRCRVSRQVVCGAPSTLSTESATRRNVFALVAASVLGLTIAQEAQAAAPAPKNASRASMEGYTLEGTRKMGVSAGKKNKLMAAARQRAEKQAGGN